VTVTVTVGNTDSATTFTGTVQNVTGGTYWCSITSPASGSMYIETTITDESTNTYTYGWKSVGLQTKLSD